MFVAADYPFLDVFWTMLVFFFWVIWIWILITVLIDLFRRHDLGGWGKAAWALFVIVLPYLGVFVYLIASGGKMQHRAMKDAADQEAAFRARVQSVAGSSGGTADELAKMADLRDRGVITEEEFQKAKAKALT